jgi:hypothetical protein
VHRFVVEVSNILLDLWNFVLRKEPDMKKRGKTLKLCALIKVR